VHRHQSAAERPGDHVHAADRLEDRGLELVDLAEDEAKPHPRTQDLGKRERLGRHRLVHQAAARIALIAAAVAAQRPFAPTKPRTTSASMKAPE